nr:hypothetical protein CFP56_02562 [Quercus suber]
MFVNLPHQTREKMGSNDCDPHTLIQTIISDVALKYIPSGDVLPVDDVDHDDVFTAAALLTGKQRNCVKPGKNLHDVRVRHVERRATSISGDCLLCRGSHDPTYSLRDVQPVDLLPPKRHKENLEIPARLHRQALGV